MNFPYVTVKESVNLITDYYEYRDVKLLIGKREPNEEIMLYVTEFNGLVHEPITTHLSATLPGSVTPVNHIFVNKYVGGKGMPEALEEGGFATKVKLIDLGYGSGYLMKLSFDAEALIKNNNDC